MNSGQGSRVRPFVRLAPALLAALLLNGILLASAALLARDRTVEREDFQAVSVNLISLRPPEIPEMRPEREPPPPPETRPRLDFTPELLRPSFERPSPGDVQIAIDPGLLRGEPMRGDFVFESGDLDTPPRVVFRAKPDYPFRARQRNIEGYVEVKLLVQADGSITSIEVLGAEPEGIFEDAALRSVPRWKFEPGMLDGRPVPSWVVTRVRFQMAGG